MSSVEAVDVGSVPQHARVWSELTVRVDFSHRPISPLGSIGGADSAHHTQMLALAALSTGYVLSGGAPLIAASTARSLSNVRMASQDELKKQVSTAHRSALAHSMCRE